MSSHDKLKWVNRKFQMDSRCVCFHATVSKTVLISQILSLNCSRIETKLTAKVNSKLKLS